MTRKQAEKKTLQYSKSGLCCTEAILKSITELYAEQPSNAIPKIGSGFCGGIGKTDEDICGTVVGGVMALGYLFGRMNKDEDNTTACEYAAEFRKRFLAKYGTTNCGELVKKFESQDNEDDCRKMTADAAGMIADMLSED
jgi:C_GCAxxG_C_C family probable redox protein